MLENNILLKRKQLKQEPINKERHILKKKRKWQV